MFAEPRYFGAEFLNKTAHYDPISLCASSIIKMFFTKCLKI